MELHEFLSELCQRRICSSDKPACQRSDLLQYAGAICGGVIRRPSKKFDPGFDVRVIVVNEELRPAMVHGSVQKNAEGCAEGSCSGSRET